MRLYEILNQTTHCGTALGYYLKIKAMSDKHLYGFLRYLWKRAESIRVWTERSYTEAPQPEGQEATTAFDLNFSRLIDMKGTEWIINTPLFDAIYKEVRKRGIVPPEEIIEAVARRSWSGIS